MSYMAARFKPPELPGILERVLLLRAPFSMTNTVYAGRVFSADVYEMML